MTLRYGSLFSGVGGFDLGFDRAGMQCAWQVDLYRPQEIPSLVEGYETKLGNATSDKQRKKIKSAWTDLIKYGQSLETLEAKYWQVNRINGVQNAGKQNLEPVDVICGGFPCQDLSVAGKRKGLDGERSGLWFEFHRIVEELKPAWVVIENVPGLLSSNGGADFAVILRGLADCGYYAAWRVLDAQFYGVPQRRRRVFVVASLGSGRCSQVLFEPQSSPWDTPPSRETGAGIAGTVKGFAPQAGGNTGLNINDELSGTLQENQVMAVFGGNNTQGPVSVASRCNAHGSRRYDFESETFIAETLNSGGNNGGFRTEPGAHLVAVPLTASPYADNEAQHGKLVAAFIERTRTKGRTLEVQEGIAYALTNPGSGGRTHSRQIVGNFGVRRLTPTECERLQGFPDGWTAGQSDSTRYRQLGNAVAVPVAEWLGKRIIGIHDHSV